MSGGGTKRIQGSGRPSRSGFQFDLTGGAHCLDLANTVDSRPSPEPVEHLKSPGDLLSWAEQAGLVDGRQARRLRKNAESRPRKAAALLSRARKLREALFALFSAAAGGDPPPRAALALLNSMMPAAMGDLGITPSGSGYQWSWNSGGERLDGLLYPVIDSACELLASADLDRVRRCESERCDWLFIDTSRNRSRRWCDMSVCGNRAKARRHYARSKKSRERNKSGHRSVSLR